MNIFKQLIGEKFGQLSLKDLIKGFIMSVLAVLVTYAGQALQTNTFPTDVHTWVLELKIALGVGIAYILKNLFTNSDDKFLKAEPKDQPSKDLKPQDNA